MRSSLPFAAKILAIIGFAVLYVPVTLMIIYSFNAGKLTSVWSGFSAKWYVALFQNDQLLTALGLSVIIAAGAATLSLVLGTLMALSLERIGGFRLRWLLAFLGLAPLVMPEVVTGLSLLLLFIGMETLFGWPSGRGIDTIMIAHATFGMCFVSVIIQARLADFDNSLEEAAADLGAGPLTVFYTVTLPVILPALIAGWLLAFTLSFDDLVIASFVSGPGSSTLPIVVFSSVRLGVTPEVNAIATLIICIASLAVLVASLFMSRLILYGHRSTETDTDSGH